MSEAETFVCDICEKEKDSTKDAWCDGAMVCEDCFKHPLENQAHPSIALQLKHFQSQHLHESLI